MRGARAGPANARRPGSAASSERGAPAFRFRRLEKPEEFRQSEELERAAGGADPSPVVPAALQKTLVDNGGLVVGAFADIYLAGSAVSTIGWDGTTLFHYSHLMVVRPEYQNHHVGTRLKAFQRDEVLALGLGEIRWTFDPLSSRAAWVYLHRLGASPDRYLPHYLGRPADERVGELESDRLHVRWLLATPAVEARLRESGPLTDEARRHWHDASPVVETEVGESGLRRPTTVAEPTGERAHLEIPFDVGTVREHEPTSMRPWRHAVRDAFRVLFDLGYVVDDFVVISVDGERRGFYLATKSPPDPGAAPSSR